jgi:hypothetical protein
LLGSTGTQSYEYAKRWIAAGHKITMLTSTTCLAEQDLVEAKERLFNEFAIDGKQYLKWK